MSERKTVITNLPNYSGETNHNPTARVRALSLASEVALHNTEVLCYKLDGNIEVVTGTLVVIYKVVERFTDRVLAVIIASTSNDTGYWKPVVERVR